MQSSLKVTLAAKCALIRSQPPCKRVGEPNFIIRASKGDCKSQTFSEGSKVYGLETELAAHTWKASFSRVCTQKISLMWKAQKRKAVALNAEHRHQLKAAAFSISWNEFADLAKGRKGSLALSSLSLSWCGFLSAGAEQMRPTSERARCPLFLGTSPLTRSRLCGRQRPAFANELLACAQRCAIRRRQHRAPLVAARTLKIGPSTGPPLEPFDFLSLWRRAPAARRLFHKYTRRALAYLFLRPVILSVNLTHLFETLLMSLPLSQRPMHAALSNKRVKFWSFLRNWVFVRAWHFIAVSGLHSYNSIMYF